jgi:hypothetical protein
VTASTTVGARPHVPADASADGLILVRADDGGIGVAVFGVGALFARGVANPAGTAAVAISARVDAGAGTAVIAGPLVTAIAHTLRAVLVRVN